MINKIWSHEAPWHNPVILNVKDGAIMCPFIWIKIKSSSGSTCMPTVCARVNKRRREDLFPVSQAAQIIIRKVWKPQQRLALPHLTYKRHQRRRQKPSPSSALELLEWRRSDASAEPALLRGGHLGEVRQPSERALGAGANSQTSCQLQEWERGWRVPAGRCQRWRNQAGLVGRVVARLAGGSCCTARQTGARHNTCGPPPTLHRCLLSSGGRRIDFCSLKSHQNNHRWLWISTGVCWLFKPRTSRLEIHMTPPAVLFQRSTR